MPIQTSATTAKTRPDMPEGIASHKAGLRCVPWQWNTITCGTRLILPYKRRSEAKDMLRTEH